MAYLPQHFSPIRTRVVMYDLMMALKLKVMCCTITYSKLQLKEALNYWFLCNMSTSLHIFVVYACLTSQIILHVFDYYIPNAYRLILP